MANAPEDSGNEREIGPVEDDLPSLENPEHGSLSEEDIERRFKLSFLQKITIGSGHVLNDLCASLWFSYFLLYFQFVANLSSDKAAVLMLIGQVVDGVSTPIIGYEADRSRECAFCRRNYGRCKSWHFYGTIFVILSFPFVFTTCIGCSESDDWAKLIYYAPFIAIFQIGWASTQISHLALIPKVNPDELIRTELLAIRYGFTVASNVLVFVLAWQTLGFKKHEEISAADADSFQYIALMAVGIGTLFSAMFHFRVREHKDEHVKQYGAYLAKKAAGRGRSGSVSPIVPARNIRGRDDFNDAGTDSEALLNEDQEFEQESRTESSEDFMHSREPERPTYSLSTRCLSLGRTNMRTKDWLSLPQFYVVALIYMATRLSVNVTQVYMPLYLQKTLKLESVTVATVPLTMYIFGFVIAMLIKFINKYAGRQLAYIFGAVLAISGATVIYFEDYIHEDFFKKYGIYGVAALLGSGASALLVTSLSITADMIGNNVENGAFVYGAMSFTDKLSCGLAVMGINFLVPCQKEDPTSCDGGLIDLLGTFYQHVIVIASGGGAAVGVLGIIFLTGLLHMQRTKMTRQLRRRLIEADVNT